MHCATFSCLLEGEVDKESKAFGLQLSLSRRGVRKRDDPVLFYTVLVPEAERRWRLGCTWRDWAGPRSTWETHNVSFVLNDCAAGTGLPFSLLSVVCCEMWKWFLSLAHVQILLGKMYPPPTLFFCAPISVPSSSSRPSPDKSKWLCKLLGTCKERVEKRGVR